MRYAKSSDERCKIELEPSTSISKSCTEARFRNDTLTAGFICTFSHANEGEGHWNTLIEDPDTKDSFTKMTGSNNALHFFDCRVRETRMQFYRTFREPKLYRFAKKFEYDKITERCKRNPAVASREAKFRHEYPPQQTALHLVLEPLLLMGIHQGVSEEMRDKRHDAAAALLKVNPESALVPCTLGTTPITMVCVDPFASLKDVDMLIRASAKSLLVPDIEGRLPLHYACINNRDNKEMIRMLVDACPEAASVEDKLRRLPLHYASMASASSSLPSSSGLDMLADILVKHSSEAPTSVVSVLGLLVQTNKDAVSAVDQNGMAPLHHLCRYLSSCGGDLPENELLAVLDLLVNADPSVLKQLDDTGCTPVSVLKGAYGQPRTGDDGSDERSKALGSKILVLCNDNGD